MVNHLRFDKYLSNPTIKLLKEQVYRMMRDQEKDDLLNQFMEWTPKANEVAVYTDYSTTEFNLPQRFDALTKCNQLLDEIKVDVTIPYSIINGWTAISKIVKGHKHVCIMQFSGDIPEVISELSEVNQTNNLVSSPLILYTSKLLS